MTKRPGVLYHVAPAGLRPGHTVSPTWGRIVRTFGDGGRQILVHADAVNLMWEVTLEATRLCLKPEAPSRLESVFCCRDRASAVTFRDRFRQQSRVYSVIPKGDTFAADYDAISASARGALVDVISQSAVLYWTQEPTGMVEVLVRGTVEILAEVQTASRGKSVESRRRKAKAK